MVQLVIFINLFFVPIIPLYVLNKKRKKPLEPNLDLLFQYSIAAVCNIPLTKVFIFLIRKIGGISISIDSGFYTLAALLPTGSAILFYIVYSGKHMEPFSRGIKDFFACGVKGLCSYGTKNSGGEKVNQLIARRLEVIISGLGGILVALALGISFYMNCVGRSLWLDEALLTTSLLKRDIWHLTSNILENNQSAPVIYLYLVKIFTILFGDSEFVLRSVSYGAYFGVVILSYCFLKKILNVSYPILGCGFVASLKILMMYASEFKQYMTEAFCVLLLLYLYAKYVRGEFQWRVLVLCLAIGIWMGNPCCFLAGAILAIEFVESVFDKKYKRAYCVVLSGCVILLSFGLYYLYWLKPVIDAGEMASYWAGNKFPMLFFTKENRQKALSLIVNYLGCFGNYRYIVGFLSLVGLFGSLREKRKENIAILVMFLLALFASSLGFFPIQDRICLFAYPLLCIVSYYSIDSLFKTGRIRTTVVGLLLCVLLIETAQGMRTYSVRDHIYRPGEEINPAIAYLEDNVNEQEKVYVYYHAQFAYEYKRDFNMSIGSGVDNVFLGTTFFNNSDREKVEKEIDYVSGQPRIYLLMQHLQAARINDLYAALRERGYLELIKNDHSTPLYFYCQSIRDSKAMCAYELLRIENTDTTCKASIRIYNTGTAFLGNGQDKLKFQSKEVMETVSAEIPNIEPGAYYDVNLTFNWGSEEEISLQLWLDDQYWFDELGVSPLKLNKYEKR